MSLNLLKTETSFKGGIIRKPINCVMDESYLSKGLVNLTYLRCKCVFRVLIAL